MAYICSTHTTVQQAGGTTVGKGELLNQSRLSSSLPIIDGSNTLYTRIAIEFDCQKHIYTRYRRDKTIADGG